MKCYYLHIIYIYRMMDEFEKVCNGAGARNVYFGIRKFVIQKEFW